MTRASPGAIPSVPSGARERGEHALALCAAGEDHVLRGELHFVRGAAELGPRERLDGGAVAGSRAAHGPRDVDRVGRGGDPIGARNRGRRCLGRRGRAALCCRRGDVEGEDVGAEIAVAARGGLAGDDRRPRASRCRRRT